MLVNNAGYGYQASIEEGDDAEIRAQFETNVFGLAAMTRAVLPGMRARRRGHIVNISSQAGFIGYPGSGYYAATKHAVEGLSDALSKEVAPLGIKVTCVEPGPFRTDWAGRSLQQRRPTIADYQETVGARLETTSSYSGQQPGDPARAAEAIVKAVEAKDPPKHLVLGAIALDGIREKLKPKRLRRSRPGQRQAEERIIPRASASNTICRNPGAWPLSLTAQGGADRTPVISSTLWECSRP